MSILSGLAYQAIAFDVPCSGAKAVATGPMLFDSTHLSYILDPTQSNQLLDVQNIQSIFVDNSGGGLLTITVSGTGFTLKVPAASQCFMPLICGDRPVVTFASDIGGTVQAWLCNTPATGVIWTVA